MSFAAAHQRTLAELARVQHERDELARFVLRLREQGALALGYLQAKGETRLAEGMRAALAGEIEPPDTEADAAEDAAYTQAVLRMQEAEAREDRAGLSFNDRAALFHAHLDACAQCASAPFSLCPVGAELIERVGVGKP